MMLRDGQVWENGKAAAKIQADGNPGYRCVKFDIAMNGLRFSEVVEEKETDILQFLKNMNMKPTEKILTLS